MGAGTAGDFGNTKGSKDKSISDKDSRRYGKPGQINKSGYRETHIGPDGRATKEIHHTDHGNPKNHSNPHEHKIQWGKDGNPIFSKK